MLRRARAWWPAIGVLGLSLVTFRWLFDGQVQAARDLYAQFFPETYFLVQRWRELEVPLWLPHERLGQPFLALLYTQVFYAPRVLTGLVFGHVVGPNVLHVFNCVLAFAGAFLALRRSGVSRAGAFVGAAGWSFSPFFVELSQNLAFASTAAWAGWTWWAADGLARKPTLRAVATLGLVQAATFHAGAPEMWLWQAALVALVVWRARRRVGAVRAAVGALAWAGAGAAVVALPAAELIFEWTAPSEPAGGLLAWSMSWQQLVSIAVPDADFPRAEPFFGADQRFFFTLLLGPAVVALAAVGGLERRARPLVLLAVGCAVLALGAHFVPSTWLLQAPPFRFFRFPVKYAVGLLFALAMLAGFGVDRLRSAARRATSELHLFAASLGGVVLGLWLAGHLLPGLREGFVRGVSWVLVSGLVLALVAQTPWRRAAIIGWVLLELLFVPRRVWPPSPAARFLEPSPIAAQIRSEPHGRVSIRVDMDDPGTPWCDTPDADDEADRVVLDSRKRLSVLRYVEEELHSTSGYGFRDPWRLARAFEQGRAAFELAGVTHFVRNAGVPLRFDGPVPSRTAIDDLWLWRSAEPTARAWVVHQAPVMTDDEAFAAIGRAAHAPRDFAPVDAPVSVSPPPDGCTSSVTTEELGPERITQQVHACADGVVVSSDAWFPGWNVFVDGQPGTPLRAWGFLRGVAVPRGEHQLEWRYRPGSFRLGALLSAVAWSAGLIVLIRRRMVVQGVENRSHFETPMRFKTP